MTKQTFVIVGASLAGAKAAETLREEGFDGRVMLVGAEPERPYERPPLSKEYLRGEAESRPYVHDEGFYAEKEIELRTGVIAEHVDPGASELTLAGNETIGFDRLLLAHGAEPRRLRVPGANLDGVLYLRTVGDSDTMRERIAGGGRVVIIGAGWIGAEVAASARQLGCEVTLLEQAQLPLERVLGPELGAIYRDIHADHGVRFVGGAAVEAIEGRQAVEGVRLGDGVRIDADVVIAGVGIEPRVGLAKEAGLAVAQGVAVDETLRTTAENIWAAGDVASAFHPVYGAAVRVEHWSNALNQGPAAARSMLGQPVSYDRIPYFFSDQYDVGMEYSGYPTTWDEVVFRGDPAEREFIAFWLKDGRVVAGMNVNVWDVNDQVQALIRTAQPVDRSRLMDPDVPLADLLPAESNAR